MKLFGVIGAGGFGREVMPLAEHTVGWKPDCERDLDLVFVVEDAYPVAQDRINGHRVMRLSDFLAAPASLRKFNIAIGDSSVRARIADSIAPDMASPFSIVAPTHVSLHGNAVGDGAIFCGFNTM